MNRRTFALYALIVFALGIGLGVGGAHLLVSFGEEKSAVQVARQPAQAEPPTQSVPQAPPEPAEPASKLEETAPAVVQPDSQKPADVTVQPAPTVMETPKPLILPEHEDYKDHQRPRAYEEEPPQLVIEAAHPTEPEPETLPKPDIASIPKSPVQNWRKNALGLKEVPPGPQIAIVIDDAGLDRRRTSQVIGLTGPMTISFLTYATKLEPLITSAKDAGHEIMLHVPMEPGNTKVDPGPKVLATALTDKEIVQRLEWGIKRVPGIIGINNHMGSRFTQDERGMRLVMEVLRRHGLMFLDSRTSTKSVGASTAKLYEVPYTIRNVFLDHEPKLEVIQKQLKHLERAARRNGYAVAIGHPRDSTIEALAQWLPVVAEKGFVLVPLSAIIAKREGIPQLAVRLDTN